MHDDTQRTPIVALGAHTTSADDTTGTYDERHVRKVTIIVEFQGRKESLEFETDFDPNIVLSREVDFSLIDLLHWEKPRRVALAPRHMVEMDARVMTHKDVIHKTDKWWKNNDSPATDVRDNVNASSNETTKGNRSDDSLHYPPGA